MNARSKGKHPELRSKILNLGWFSGKCPNLNVYPEIGVIELKNGPFRVKMQNIEFQVQNAPVWVKILSLGCLSQKCHF